MARRFPFAPSPRPSSRRVGSSVQPFPAAAPVIPPPVPRRSFRRPDSEVAGLTTRSSERRGSVRREWLAFPPAVAELGSVRPARSLFCSPPRSFCSPWRSFSGALRSFCSPPQTFSSARRSFCSLLRSFCSPQKTFSGAPQSFCSPQKIFSPAQKTFYAPQKTCSLPQKTSVPPLRRGSACLTRRSSEQRLAGSFACFFTLVPPASVAELGFVRRLRSPPSHVHDPSLAGTAPQLPQRRCLRAVGVHLRSHRIHALARQGRPQSRRGSFPLAGHHSALHHRRAVSLAHRLGLALCFCLRARVQRLLRLRRVPCLPCARPERGQLAEHLPPPAFYCLVYHCPCCAARGCVAEGSLWFPAA